MDGVPIALFSMEQPSCEIAERWLSIGSGIPMHRFAKSGRIEEQEAQALVGTAGVFSRLPIFIDDTSNMPVARIATLLRRGIRKWGIRVGVVDYLGLLQPESAKENKTLQVGTLALRMKNLARATGIPIILLCQLISRKAAD